MLVKKKYTEYLAIQVSLFDNSFRLTFATISISNKEQYLGFKSFRQLRIAKNAKK